MSEKPEVLVSPEETSQTGAFSVHPKENILIQLRWKQCNLNEIVEISASVNEPIRWRGVGMISSLLQFSNSIQTTLWKLASAFPPLKVWEGKLNIKDNKYNLSFRVNQSHPFSAYVLTTERACAMAPGKLEHHCEHCILHASINSSMLLNLTFGSLYILRVLCESCLRVSHRYNAYVKLG